jgi:hypothetical protein
MTRDYFASYFEDANGCWNYTGTVSPKGYGQILQTTAHRWFYTQLVGPILEGLTLDHLCLNKRCVNPAHLEPVTLYENLRRRHAATTHCKRGHEFTAETTYWKPRAGGKRTRECVPCRYARWVDGLGRPVKPIGRPRKEPVHS